MSVRVVLPAFFLVALFLAAPVWGEGPPRVIEGRYLGSEAGDYNYLLLDAGGQQMSFFCNPLITEILDARPPSLPISVTFTAERQFLPEANQEIDMLIVKSVFIADEYAPDFGVSITESSKP